MHSYSTSGVFNATLRVTDDTGLTDIDTVEITADPGVFATLSNDVLDPTLGQTVSIHSVLTTEAIVTVLIKDRTGNVVRTLVNSVARAAGYYSDLWDGRDSGGQIVADGAYLYIIEYEVGAHTYTYDITNDVIASRYTPSVTYPPSFNPFSAETNYFRYTLSDKSEVTIYIAPFSGGAGERIKTLLLRKPQPAGSYVKVWDGTDDRGDLVPPGNYVIAVMGWRLAENVMIVSAEPILSDVFVTPTYLNPRAMPYDEEDQTDISFTLSKQADVTVSIYNAKNYLIRSITVNDVPAGPGNTITWDGKNNSGKYVDPGTCRLTVVATDANGYNSMPANALIEVFY
jgi:flagellar hook assembly protein FlgD